jgi:diguanylate cyclase (GGDEF)-like protein
MENLEFEMRRLEEERDLYLRHSGFVALLGKEYVLGNSEAVRLVAEKVAKAGIEMEERSKLLEEMAMIDPLTNLYNRRAFYIHGENAIKTANRDGEPLSLAMFDIDYFKDFNTKYGHKGGDSVLKTLGEIVSNNGRTSDLAHRVGGEEFIILYHNTEKEMAKEKMIELTNKIKNTEMVFLDKNGNECRDRISISAGVACYSSNEKLVDEYDVRYSLECLSNDADRLAYHSKESGRGRVSWVNSSSGVEQKVIK